ncbi:FtsK/SpoIIIE domain-containing protein [Streptomyces europaeiscabiei]|uniref:FtsK/SpoIIIE domain-containing protein n=1 Tax=Streptomyces europaeiscabiei TaxID=146819 RepID=UPI0029AA90F1|nr:FtsK/SpoIIIE domain-containing protein [Streptomyces europaeiscabiei]MDX3714407.1 FtsK/SpoIIIE domain-containing protein [Streptomyces europaeiscabiei]
MKIDRTDIVTAVTVPGLVSAAAFTADGIYGTTAAAIEFGTAIAAGSLSWTSFSKKWPPALAWGSLALAGVSGQAWLTGTVGGFAALYGYAISAAAVFAGMVKYRHDTRHDAIKLEHETARLNTTLIRQQMAHHALVQKTTPEPVQSGPDLTGRTVEETRLRTVVHELFAAELPGCTVERTRTGWTAVLDLPVNLDRDKLRTAWPKVASGMGVAGEFMLEDGALTNQLVAKFIDGDPLADAVPYTRSTAARFTEPVLLGVDRFLNPVYLDLAYNHTLIAGSSKFGKSTLVRSIAVQLADRPDVVLYGIDMKPGAPELTPMLPILQDLAATAEQAHALLDWLKQELAERGEILAKAGDQEWDPQKHGRPAIWVIEDELAELVRQGDDGPWKKNPASKKNQSLLALLRFAGIHKLSATQQPSRQVFGGTTDARGNYTNRLSTRMNDADHRRFIFGNIPGWEPGKLDQPGKFLLQSPVHQVAAPYKGMWLTGEEFKAEVARIGATTVRAPVGKRLILPVSGATNQEKIRAALTKYGNATRRELEIAAGLGEKQVLDAARALRPEVERCEDTGTWRLVPVGAWETQAVAQQ